MHPENKLRIGAVVIGRNEGARLIACLDALQGMFEQIIYVDSGSTDNSVAEAKKRDAQVVELDISIPFTAARARNAGLDALLNTPAPPDLVQFIDGDCVIDPNWVDHAVAHLEENPKIAVTCGRLRERFPEASRYNRMIDAEWDTPVGETKACGGICIMRRSALQAVGPFNSAMIAGEEPELCIRLRQAGWIIWRLDTEMALHDANLLRFGQWWRRARRAGYAFAEGAAMHGAPPEKHFVRETRSALIWGAALPAALILVVFWLGPTLLLGLLIWPLQVLRLCRKGMSLENAVFLMLAKFPEARGGLEYYWKRATKQRMQLIEHK